MIRTILARLREPSSMAGLACIAALVGMPPGYIEPVAQLAAAMASVAAVVFPERP